MLARVYVTPKRGILDPQGRAVLNALHALRYGEALDARAGKYFELRLGPLDRARAQARVREMCERLLANLVIEDYRFEILDD